MKCAKCGATGCKLWREYQTFDPRLLCVDCAGLDQDKDVSQMDEFGTRPCTYNPERRTDQIGWYVPAVETEGGYWGYTSVPDDALARWRALPTRTRGVPND